MGLVGFLPDCHPYLFLLKLLTRGDILAEKALVNNAVYGVLQNGGVITVNGAVEVFLVVFGHNTFKLQGSSDGGTTYNDIAGSSCASDTTLAKAWGVSIYRSLFNKLKVVTDTGYVVVIQRWLRMAPQGGTPVPPNLFIKPSNSKLLVDPTLGTP